LAYWISLPLTRLQHHVGGPYFCVQKGETDQDMVFSNVASTNEQLFKFWWILFDQFYGLVVWI